MGLFRRRKVDDSWATRLAAGPWPFPADGIDDDLISVQVTSPGVAELLAGQRLTGGGSYIWQWAVRTCVDFLAKNIAHLNLKAYRRTDDTPEPLDRDHPLVQLIQRPNARTTRFDLMRGTVSDLAIYDEAFWLKRFGVNERNIFRLPASMVEPLDSSIIGGPKSYRVDTGSGQQEFSPEEIVHFHGYSPSDPFRGMTPMKALQGLLNEEREASRYMAKLLRKGMRFGGFLTSPADRRMDDIALKRFIEGMKRFARGGDREGEWMLLEDGIQPQQSSFSPKDAELMSVREFVLDITATAYHIPLSMLSRTDSQAFASMREFHKILYTDVLGPWNAMIEAAIWLQLLPEFNDPDLFVEFNIDEKMQGDFAEQANAARQSVQVPWESVNSMRKKRNEPPIGDPNDPDNPYNIPARPRNYDYGNAAQAAQQPQLSVAARNGHPDIDARRLDDLDTVALERILEER